MMKKLLISLFRTGKTEGTKPAEAKGAKRMFGGQKEPRYALGNGMYWEFEQVRNGYGGYKTVNAYLLKMGDPGFRRCIVNRDGEIQNFPGFQERSWERELEIPTGAQRVNFAFWIHPYQNGKAHVSWMVQPDGRYFADEDGYGAEHFDEISMYSYLDEEGNFTEPFSLK